MLKKLSKKDRKGIDERSATYIPPQPIDCFIGCNITCDPGIPLPDMAYPTGWVCYDLQS
jgi:hypothetical protein